MDLLTARVSIERSLPVAAICTDLRWRYKAVFAGDPVARLRKRTQLRPNVLTTELIRSGKEDLSDIEVLFATWGVTKFEPEDLERLPSLRAVFYAAGSVRPFAENLLKRGITVSSAWNANAIPVSEYTLANILLACKGFLPNTASMRMPDPQHWRGDAPHGPGIYGQRVALVGQGAIGQRVLRLLEPFDLIPVLVESYPELDPEALRQAFSSCLVVSNHLADRPEWHGLFNTALFDLMPEGATFINTGRGAQVNENDLFEVFRNRPDLTAILDVTKPEPPDLDSPLRSLPNVYISSHISGSINEEVRRMAQFMIEEFDRWQNNEPLQHEVKLEQFSLLA